MLIEFKAANFRSIRDEQTLSFVASNYSDELANNLITRELPGLAGTKFLKGVGIYGSNASGKSNILRALQFMAKFVSRSATDLEPTGGTGTEHFKLDPEYATRASRFEVSAVLSNVRMLYGLELNRQRVTREYLVAYPKGKPQVWFERDWDDKSEKYVWSKATPNFKHDDALRDRTRENAAFISVAAQWNQEQATMVWRWFNENLRFLDLSNATLDHRLTLNIIKNKEARLRVIRLLRSADLGISDIRVNEPLANNPKSKITISVSEKDNDPSTVTIRPSTGASSAEEYTKELNQLLRKLQPLLIQGSANPRQEFLHQAKGGELVPLNFDREESAGTRRYFAVIGEWLQALEAGRIVVIDELETSLHPVLVRELLHLLFASVPNSTDMQIVFTTHNPILLDQTLLRRDQIWLAEKDREGATRLYPLTNYKPRKDEALVKGYLAGRYGGIPFIPEGLAY